MKIIGGLWKRLTYCCMLLMFLNLDPRTKLKALQYYLVKCSGPEWAKQIETNVKDLLNRLWE